MAVTLAQAGYLETDAMKKGIIQTIINESPFMRRLPFIGIQGNAYKYNLQTTATSIGWYTVGSTITESTPVWAQRSVELSELIVDADVDKFVAQVRSSEQDVKATVIEQAAIDFKDEFEKMAIQGYVTDELTTYQMKGLMKLLAEVESATTTDWDWSANAQICYPSATSGELTLAAMDELRDLIKPGRPDAFIMSRRMQRKLTTLTRAAGCNLEHDNDQLGFPVEKYGGIEILICDHVLDNISDGSSGEINVTTIDQDVTRASGYDNSVIFAVKWGEKGICGIQNGGIDTEDIGTLSTKDATRTRIKWYVGMANFSKSSIAAMVNVLDTAL